MMKNFPCVTAFVLLVYALFSCKPAQDKNNQRSFSDTPTAESPQSSDASPEQSRTKSPAIVNSENGESSSATASEVKDRRKFPPNGRFFRSIPGMESTTAQEGFESSFALGPLQQEEFVTVNSYSLTGDLGSVFAQIERYGYDIRGVDGIHIFLSVNDKGEVLPVIWLDQYLGYMNPLTGDFLVCGRYTPEDYLDLNVLACRFLATWSDIPNNARYDNGSYVRQMSTLFYRFEGANAQNRTGPVLQTPDGSRKYPDGRQMFLPGPDQSTGTVYWDDGQCIQTGLQPGLVDGGVMFDHGARTAYFCNGQVLYCHNAAQNNCNKPGLRFRDSLATSDETMFFDAGRVYYLDGGLLTDGSNYYYNDVVPTGSKLVEEDSLFYPSGGFLKSIDGVYDELGQLAPISVFVDLKLSPDGQNLPFTALQAAASKNFDIFAITQTSSDDKRFLTMRQRGFFGALISKRVPNPENVQVEVREDTLTFSWDPVVIRDVEATYMVTLTDDSRAPRDCRNGLVVGRETSVTFDNLTPDRTYVARICTIDQRETMSEGTVWAADTASAPILFDCGTTTAALNHLPAPAETKYPMGSIDQNHFYGWDSAIDRVRNHGINIVPDPRTPYSTTCYVDRSTDTFHVDLKNGLYDVTIINGDIETRTPVDIRVLSGSDSPASARAHTIVGQFRRLPMQDILVDSGVGGRPGRMSISLTSPTGVGVLNGLEIQRTARARAAHLNLHVDRTTLYEATSAGSQILATVSRTGDISDAAKIRIVDPTGGDKFDWANQQTLTIPAGQTSIDFVIKPRDTGAYEGDNYYTITVESDDDTPVRYIADAVEIRVFDDEIPRNGINPVRFDCGWESADRLATGFIAVTGVEAYGDGHRYEASQPHQYGWDLASQVTRVFSALGSGADTPDSAGNRLSADACLLENQTFNSFKVDLPLGEYRVQVGFGDDARNTEVRALAENVALHSGPTFFLPAGRFQSLILERVRLDDGTLDLNFMLGSGAKAAITSIEIQRVGNSDVGTVNCNSLELPNDDSYSSTLDPITHRLFRTWGVTWRPHPEGRAYQGTITYTEAGGLASKGAEWRQEGLERNVEYKVYVTWTEWTNRVSRAKFRVFDGNSSREAFSTDINQQKPPSASGNLLDYDSRIWRELTSLTPTSGTIRVQLDAQASGNLPTGTQGSYVVADGVLIVPQYAQCQ